MDAGSFVFDALGVRWVQDLGMQEYYSLEKENVDLWNMSQNGQRWNVFRYNNLAHNTLTVNGKYPVSYTHLTRFISFCSRFSSAI